MENQITQKVEAAVRSVNGVDEINSSVREGNSSTFVQFEIGTPTDRAVNDVRDAIAQIRGDLPDGILEPQINRVDIAGDPILFVAAETTDMSLEELSWYVDNTVSRRLLGVEGIAAVSREGGVDRADPRHPRSGRAAGAGHHRRAGQPAASPDQPQRRRRPRRDRRIRAVGARARQRPRPPMTCRRPQIVVPGGRMVRLADLGEVKDAYSEQRTIAKMNGRAGDQLQRPARPRARRKSPTYDEAWKELRKIEKEDPGIRFLEIFNSVDYTKQQYQLGDGGPDRRRHPGRAGRLPVPARHPRDPDFRARHPAVGDPGLLVHGLMGITLNCLSLLALSLVAGVLVDDAIVEIENIVRHMRMGKSAYQASIDAADEIGLAVLATTMSIVAVFLPVALMPGISGQFFKSFGYTVVVSVLMSLFVARMITPLIAAYFLKAHGVQPHASGKAMDTYLATLNWSLNTEQCRRISRADIPASGAASSPGCATIAFGWSVPASAPSFVRRSCCS